MKPEDRAPGTADRSVPGFLPGERCSFPPTGTGVLRGLRFAVKDNIDIEGYVTGAGNPRWAETHGVAPCHAPLVDRLLAAGASLVGKTICEELAYSVIGDNQHFGIPINPASLGRFPGGSSSGSASVVAAGQADFSLGTDTAGSVRVPASNCGIYGFRPSHGIFDMTGVIPLAPSFDVVGWFATSAETLFCVGDAILPDQETHYFDGYWTHATTFETLPDEHRKGLELALKNISLPCRGSLDGDQLWPQRSAELGESLRVLQAREAWLEHGEWVEQAPAGTIAEDIKERFLSGRLIDAANLEAAAIFRRRLLTEVGAWFAADRVIAFPTVGREALPVGASKEHRAAYRQSVIRSTCLSSLTGLPEVTVPLPGMTDAPIGLSFIGPRFSDRALLRFTNDLFPR